MKKPGEFKAAQLRHQKRQSVTDKLRALKSGEIVLLPAKLNHEWETVRVAPLGTPSIYSLALGIAGKTCQVFTNYEKDGKHTTVDGYSYYSRQIDFRGVIMELPELEIYKNIFDYYKYPEPRVTGYYDNNNNIYYWLPVIYWTSRLYLRKNTCEKTKQKSKTKNHRKMK